MGPGVGINVSKALGSHWAQALQTGPLGDLLDAQEFRRHEFRRHEFRNRWERWSLRLARLPLVGVLGRRLARLGYRPYTGDTGLARHFPEGYRSPLARVHADKLETGKHCYIGDHALLMNEPGGGAIKLGDHVLIFEHTTLLTIQGGSIEIGDGSHIQPRCQFSAAKGSIKIGKRAEIAPACAFYPYNHGLSADLPVRDQPLTSRGGITIGDDVWLGYGVIVLDGVHIGDGAVIAAGAVVVNDIPAMAIAAGVPARVSRLRVAGNEKTENCR